MFSFRDQHHMVMSPTPGQAAFGRDMLFDIPAKVSSRLKQEPKDTQAHRTNCQEDDERIFHEYGPDDLVLVAMSDRRTPNTQPLFDGPFRIVSVRSNGIVVIDKDKYYETVHGSRVEPFCATNVGKVLGHDAKPEISMEDELSEDPA
ncbi:hypothetical protein PI124_g6500 [Phytophthora idaei]|nr:hypothetical protein PI125_g6189 [Phytophthora idaei]KAG3162451.1 hypothetical protein PI126_g5967 [Phytophthora idaei]KAG3248819.1 hypothetical protein PI124_g6500 [Phytophthora idaei]